MSLRIQASNWHHCHLPIPRTLSMPLQITLMEPSYRILLTIIFLTRRSKTLRRQRKKQSRKRMLKLSQSKKRKSQNVTAILTGRTVVINRTSTRASSNRCNILKACHHSHNNTTKCILTWVIQTSASHLWCIHMACHKCPHMDTTVLMVMVLMVITEVTISSLIIEMRDQGLDPQSTRPPPLKQQAIKSNNLLLRSTKTVASAFRVSLRARIIRVGQTTSTCKA